MTSESPETHQPISNNHRLHPQLRLHQGIGRVVCTVYLVLSLVSVVVVLVGVGLLSAIYWNKSLLLPSVLLIAFSTASAVILFAFHLKILTRHSSDRRGRVPAVEDQQCHAQELERTENPALCMEIQDPPPSYEEALKSGSTLVVNASTSVLELRVDSMLANNIDVDRNNNDDDDVVIDEEEHNDGVEIPVEQNDESISGPLNECDDPCTSREECKTIEQRSGVDAVPGETGEGTDGVIGNPRAGEFVSAPTNKRTESQ